MPGVSRLDPKLITLHLQSSGPLSAEALAQKISVDRLTIQRAIRKLAPHVVQLGKTRGTRYALRRTIANNPDLLRIYRFNLDRTLAHAWVTLAPLYGGWQLKWASTGVTPEWADRVHDYSGFCEGMPFFLTDLRPQGYLGRAIARRLPSTLGLSSDPRAWSDDQLLTYLLHHGTDLPGNLAIGDEAVKAALSNNASDALSFTERLFRYSDLAARADAGEATGSSVEGEQPKFTTRRKRGEETTAVLVKFTDKLDTPSGRRWADLLEAEAIALRTLGFTSQADTEARSPETIDIDGRRFYEIPRFDRVGSSGRRGVVSLRALYDAGFSKTDTNQWPIVAAGLHEAGWISAKDLAAIELRHTFGQLIGNTDMHFGNLAFILDLGLPLKLAPTYDMLPMLWAPRPGNSEPTPAFSPPPPLPQNRDTWVQAATLADQFWQAVQNSPSISEPFRALAANAHDNLKAMRQLVG